MTSCLPIKTIAAHVGRHVTMAHGPRGFEMHACIGQVSVLEQGQRDIE